MSHMQWTKEIPKIDGWYWVKYRGNAWIDEIIDASILDGWTDELIPITEEGLEFYGPLEEPK